MEPQPNTEATVSNDETTAAASEKPDQEKRFSQADVDRMFAGRLAKFNDYDAVKEQLANFQQQAMSDQERAIHEAVNKAVAERDAKWSERILDSQARLIAQELGFRDPADVFRYVDRSQVPLTEDGVDEAALRAAVEQVATDKPYLVAPQQAEPPAATDLFGTVIPSAAQAGLGTTRGSSVSAVDDFVKAFQNA